MEELKKLMIEGFQQLNSKIDGVAEKVDGVEKRLDGVEIRLGGVENRLDGLETRLDGLETRFDGLETRFDGVENRLGGVEIRLDGMQEHMDKLEDVVDEIKVSQIRMEGDMKQNFGALYDSRESQIDTNEKMICSLTRIESKLERADLRSLYATNRLAHK